MSLKLLNDPKNSIIPNKHLDMIVEKKLKPLEKFSSFATKAKKRYSSIAVAGNSRNAAMKPLESKIKSNIAS